MLGSIRYIAFLILGALMICRAAPVAAERGEIQPIDRHGPVQPYLRAQLDVRKQVDKSRRYRGLDEEARSRLFAAQDQLFALLGDTRNFQDLNELQRAELDAIEPELNAAMVAVRDQEVICTRERSTGSQITQPHCATRAERERLREATTLDMERRRQAVQSDLCPPETCIIPPEGGRRYQ
jgi:hypothetical protein